MSQTNQHILMVCLGNICRSPLAEGVLRHKIKQSNLKHIVDSAGTADYHVGDAPDIRSQNIAKQYGIDISTLRGRQFVKEDFDKFDHIFVMDSSNLKNVVRLSSNPVHHNKVKLILNVLDPGSDQEVPDPYYGGLSGFEHVYQLLDRACDKIVKDYLIS